MRRILTLSFSLACALALSTFVIACGGDDDETDVDGGDGGGADAGVADPGVARSAPGAESAGTDVLKEGSVQDAVQCVAQICGSNLPPCPTGYHCSTSGPRGSCELDNPPACGPALPDCPTGCYCFAYPRGYCRPSP